MASSAKDHAMRDSPDISALKVEYDDDRSLRGMPSPLRTAQSANDHDSANTSAAAFNTSYFVPQFDSGGGGASGDVAMADGASDAATTDTTTAAAGPPKKPTQRKPAHKSGAAATRVPGATARSRGGGSVGRSNSRGGGSLRGRGGSPRSNSSSSKNPKKSNKHLLTARHGPSRSSSRNKTGGGGSSHRRGGTTSTASPSPSIKRESPDDDNDNDDDDDDDDHVGVEDDADGSDISSLRDSSLRESDNDDSDLPPEHGPHRDGEISDDGPYCICRGPDDHRWMIQCDQCEDWFHGDCVHIDKEIGEHLVQSYICPNCTIPDGSRYVTRFRKMCSLPSCRRPARLYGGADGASAAAPDEASYFCSDAHRDQWWDALLGRVTRSSASSSNSGSGGGSNHAGGQQQPRAEDKMAVDLLTPAQLVAVLASSDQPGVAEMLLHGLSSHNKNSDPDDLLTDEERTFTRQSAADRYRLAEQLVMCKKMLQLLDMAKARNYDAIKAGLIERDCCGYDDRLQHVAVQPHFERFLASSEGVAVFQAGRLGPPQFDENGDPLETEEPKGDTTDTNMEAADNNNNNNNNNSTDGVDNAAAAAAAAESTAGMCRKRKCKAHLGWLPTLGRDVRMQMQDLTRQAAVLRDNETRIRLAAVQRAFVKQHMTSEVRYVGDSDNSLSSLASDDDGSEDGTEREREDNNNNDDDDDDDDDGGEDESFQDAQSRQRYSSASASSPRRSAPASRSRSRSRSPDYRSSRSNGYQRHRDRSYSREQSQDEGREETRADASDNRSADRAYRRRNHHESSTAGESRRVNGHHRPRSSNGATPRSVDTYSD